MKENINDSLIKNQKYEKLLNNLLDINGREQCLFFKVNGVTSFDITSKFGETYSKKILSQKNFTLNLSEVDLEQLLEIVQNSSVGSQVIDAYEKYKEKLFNSKKVLLDNPESFAFTKKGLIDDLEQKIQKVRTRWIQFHRKVLEANIQENVWQLHVATLFISVKTASKDMYCPLILREVTLDVNNAKIKITSQDSWKINEKAVFLLKEAGFYIDENIFFEDMNALEVIPLVLQQLNLLVDTKILTKSFTNFSSTEIRNKKINIHSGVVLGMFKPSGGHIRKTMLKIIENDEIDEILDVDPDKTIFKNKIMKTIESGNDKVIRIQKGNFSQDKALISALMQDTVIWGPPGTGKSQVIANIIANILYKNKTAVVMSQKKVALDVLKKRLGKVAPFALFVLNDNKMLKSEFYKPLENFINYVENREVTLQNIDKKSIISQPVVRTLNNIWNAKQDEAYFASIKLMEIFKENDLLLKKMFALKANLKYPTKILPFKEYLKELVFINELKLPKLFFIPFYPLTIRQQAELGLYVLKNVNYDINSLVNLLNQTSYEIISSLKKSVDILNYKNEYKSDENYLVSVLSERVIKDINYWKQTRSPLFEAYKKFASAVRAGRRLPFKFMSDHWQIIRKLFPVVITTPETSFISWEKQYFDYAVLDETSQIFLEVGLSILYVSKIKVLVGDPEQMQPSRWFRRRDDEERDEDIVENAESILDYALHKGVHKIILNQNFRSSSAALMSFSSKKFYNSELEVIDNKHCNNTNHNSIVVKNINGIWENRVNEIEADEVIKIANAEIDNYETIIILTFNSNQSQLIEKKIIERETILYKSLESGKLVIRNIENIQGDEADLVIASVVYDKTTNIWATYVARANAGKNALNVAISRAKDKMIVVKSVKATDLKAATSEDFQVFKEWLEFLDKSEDEKRTFSIMAQNNKIIESYGEVDSNFERDVIDEIKNSILTIHPYKLIKQYEVGSKKIDIAFVNDNGNYILGIEVDGYIYHGGMGIDKYLEDSSRQAFLETKGYNIYRIREIDWKIKKNNILKEISYLLNQV